MRQCTKRWYVPALLLFLILFSAACRQTTAENTPPAPSRPAEVVFARPDATETASLESSPTPMPRVGFMGIEFFFDEASFGPLGTAEHHAPVPPGQTAAQPEHLEIRLQAGDEETAPLLYVFPVQQYEAMSEAAAAEIADLRSLLAERPAEILRDLPFLPMYLAVESYHSDPKYIDFQNGSGISYLARVDHDHSLSTDESIFYTFQGLTTDGRYYVAAMVPITDVAGDEIENPDPDSAVHESETTAHSAKAAANNGNWISIDLGNGRSLIDDMMFSLYVAPDESFPSIKLPNVVTANGFFAAYDEAVSGRPSFEQGPALVKSPTGELEFLQDVPDMLTFRFQQEAPEEQEVVLHIQPIRGVDGAFFESIPAWQQEYAAALKQDHIADTTVLDMDGPVSEMRPIAFQNGSGFRGIMAAETAEAENAAPDYIFRGITSDGLYLVGLDHALPEGMDRQAALTYLDSVVQSILITADASTDSSIPVNSDNCENNIAFIEDVSIPDYTIVERGDTFAKIWRIRNSGTCTLTPAYQVAFAQGNPVEWQPLAITDIVPPGEETEVGITLQSPDYPGIYHAWWQVADENGQKFGDLLSLLFEAPKAATDIPGYGVIEGHINYPANGIPAMEIYFQPLDGSELQMMQTEYGWTKYSKAVPAGVYHVFARVQGDTSDSGGGYTQAVICGLQANCDDHSLLEVVVEEGRARREISISDWYAPAGSFPLPDPVATPDVEPTPENS
ncbi:MAG: NBR1-Ig-like domain-containing protein [Candidatus Promineifilaceae bacterium]